jgi:hypothetical protein
LSAVGPTDVDNLLDYYLCTGDPASDPTGGVSYVRSHIYTEDYLAIDLTAWKNGNSGLTLIEYIDTISDPPVPPVNKLLIPLMFVDTVQGTGANGQSVPLLRYPGALVSSDTAPSHYTVKVPIIINRGSTSDPRPGSATPLLGAETIVWHNVIEAIKFSDGSDNPPGDVFSVVTKSSSGSTSTFAAPTGLAAVRVNYPFQAASMVSYPPPANPSQPFVVQNELSTFRVINPNVAEDNQVSASDPYGFLKGGSPVAPSSQPGFYSGTYGGPYGLGAVGAVNLQVRPFRKTITCQAIYRREVFGP